GERTGQETTRPGLRPDTASQGGGALPLPLVQGGQGGPTVPAVRTQVRLESAGQLRRGLCHEPAGATIRTDVRHVPDRHPERGDTVMSKKKPQPKQDDENVDDQLYQLEIDTDECTSYSVECCVCHAGRLSEDDSLKQFVT